MRICAVLEVYHDFKLEGFANIVMTKISGNDLSEVMDKMSDAELKSIVKELSGYMMQLRRLEKDIGGNTPAIGGVGGIPCFDTRIASIPFGPFATIANFHTCIRRKEPIECWEYEPNVMAVHGKPEGTYKLKLTHNDIAPRNIRVKHGKMTGIIDWEFSGWYPELNTGSILGCFIQVNRKASGGGTTPLKRKTLYASIKLKRKRRRRFGRDLDLSDSNNTSCSAKGAGSFLMLR